MKVVGKCEWEKEINFKKANLVTWGEYEVESNEEGEKS